MPAICASQRHYALQRERSPAHSAVLVQLEVRPSIRPRFGFPHSACGVHGAHICLFPPGWRRKVRLIGPDRQTWISQTVPCGQRLDNRGCGRKDRQNGRKYCYRQVHGDNTTFCYSHSSSLQPCQTRCQTHCMTLQTGIEEAVRQRSVRSIEALDPPRNITRHDGTSIWEVVGVELTYFHVNFPRLSNLRDAGSRVTTSIV